MSSPLLEAYFSVRVSHRTTNFAQGLPSARNSGFPSLCCLSTCDARTPLYRAVIAWAQWAHP